MTQVYYILPLPERSLPSICQRGNCLKTAIKGTKYCESHQPKQKLKQKPCWHKKKVVYMIGVEGSSHIKIGYASDLMSRLSALQVGTPNNLVMIAVFEGSKLSESLLHRRLIDQNIRGEWFNGEKVISLLKDIVIDDKLRKSFYLGKILAYPDKMAYSFSNNG